MKKFSLKLRLILSFLLVSAAVFAASSVLSWVETRDQMDEFFDTYQMLLARQLSSADWNSVKNDTQIKTNKIVENLMNDGEEDDEALGFAVFEKGGRIVFHDGENGKHFGYNPNPSGFVQQKIGKNKWRIVWMKSADERYVIAVGQELDFRVEAALEIIAQTLIPWGIGLVVLMLASVLLISSELRPIGKTAKDIYARKPDDLSPIINDKMPKEIAPLLSAMNRMLKRIESMIERERGFISDAAHELRSPLAALKVQLDVALISEKDKDAKRKALGNVEKGIDRLNRLVEQLLTLSRLEASGKHNYGEEALDWEKIVEEVIAENEVFAKAKKITVEVVNDGKPIVKKGKNLLWVLLLRNLLDNAIKYSPNKAKVVIEIKDGELKVINSGTVVSEDVLKNLGNRFFRPSGQDVSGSGLGLSIVKRVAEIHNCKVSFANKQGYFVVSVFRK